VGRGISANREERGEDKRTFSAPVQEQSAFLQEVLGDVGQFFDLVGHDC